MEYDPILLRPWLTATRSCCQVVLWEREYVVKSECPRIGAGNGLQEDRRAQS